MFFSKNSSKFMSPKSARLTLKKYLKSQIGSNGLVLRHEWTNPLLEVDFSEGQLNILEINTQN